MKTAAIIAEFNPFHNGHKYLLDTVKKEHGIDYCIAIMSGDYVQRGDVAVVSKHKRAEMAIKAGFSAVFELPLIYATSSAPDFAYGGVCIADALGVDYLFFGSESGNINSLNKIADALSSPSEEFDQIVNTSVKKGMSYAKAVSEALKATGICSDDFSTPNDILAVEYIKALKKLNSCILPVAIKRTGVDHNSLESNQDIASATMLRSALKDNQDIRGFIPEALDFSPVFSDDFFDMLSYRLHFISDDELENTLGVSQDLANKIRKNQNATEYRAMLEGCKSKNFSESTIRRAYVHILLGITKNPDYFMDGHIKCPDSVRLLAMSKNDSFVIRYFKEKENIKIYTKPKEIIDCSDSLLLLDMKSSDLYEKVYSAKYKTDFLSDCQKSPIIQ